MSFRVLAVALLMCDFALGEQWAVCLADIGRVSKLVPLEKYLNILITAWALIQSMATKGREMRQAHCLFLIRRVMENPLPRNWESVVILV